MLKRLLGTMLSVGALFCSIGSQTVAAQAASGPAAQPLSDSLLMRLPAAYREQIRSLVKGPERYQQRLAAMSDDALDATIIQVLGAKA